MAKLLPDATEFADRAGEWGVSEADERVREALLERGLRVAGQSDRSAGKQKNSEPWKIRIARELERRTNAPNARMAERLNMNVPQAVSGHAGRFDSGRKRATEGHKDLIQRITE